MPSKIVWPMLISALRSAKERRATATNRIRRWRREWRNRFGKCFPAALPKKRARLRRTPPVRGSGRVGRTAPGRALDEEALRAAVIAAIRHRHTDYDRLLMKGWDRMDARNAVRGDVNRVLDEWRKA